MNKRIETKVYGAVVGTALGGALATFLVWLLGVLVWHAPNTAAAADDALRAVPYPVSGLLLALLGLAGTAVGGYSAPRTTDAERGVVTTNAQEG